MFYTLDLTILITIQIFVASAEVNQQLFLQEKVYVPHLSAIGNFLDVAGWEHLETAFTGANTKNLP